MSLIPFISRYNINEFAIRNLCRYVWGFTRNAQLSFYENQMNSSSKHLEIGCASVLLPANAIGDKLNAKFDLLDIDLKPLLGAKQNMISQGIPQENIQLFHTNALELNRVSLPEYKYDSIGISNTLHYIPGAISEKLPSIIDGLADNMDQDTVLFGCTTCGDQFIDDPLDYVAKPLTWNDLVNVEVQPKIVKKYCHYLQKKKVFCNEDDKHMDLGTVLDEYFHEYQTEKIGYVSVFVARKFKK